MVIFRKLSIFLFAAYLLIFASAPAYASSGLARTNLLSLAFRGITASYQWSLNSGFYLGPNAGYWHHEDEKFEVFGGALGASGTWKFDGKALSSGWLLRPFLNYASIKFTEKSLGKAYSGWFSFLYMGTLFGHQWFWKEKIGICLGLGAALYSLPAITTLEAADGSRMEANFPFSNLGPVAEISVSMAF